MDLKQGQVTANRLNFAYLEAGSGPLALCLHGFPDSPWTYRYLLPALAEAGYRAVAPFMRGYAPTEIPADGHYRTSDLAADAVALHQALGGDGEAVLIAHDWGATTAWGATTLEPQRWRRVVIANVPPLQILGPIAFRYDQVKRSFYCWFFQMSIAESIVGANNLAFIDGLWADWSPGYNATDDLARVKECLRDPANLRAAMGYTTLSSIPPASARPNRRPSRKPLGAARRPSPRCTFMARTTAASLSIPTQRRNCVPSSARTRRSSVLRALATSSSSRGRRRSTTGYCGSSAARYCAIAECSLRAGCETQGGTGPER